MRAKETWGYILPERVFHGDPSLALLRSSGAPVVVHRWSGAPDRRHILAAARTDATETSTRT